MTRKKPTPRAARRPARPTAKRSRPKARKSRAAERPEAAGIAGILETPAFRRLPLNQRFVVLESLAWAAGAMLYR